MSKVLLEASAAISLGDKLSRIQDTPPSFGLNQGLVDTFVDRMDNAKRLNKALSAVRLGMQVGVELDYVEIDDETALAIAWLLEHQEK